MLPLLGGLWYALLNTCQPACAFTLHVHISRALMSSVSSSSLICHGKIYPHVPAQVAPLNVYWFITFTSHSPSPSFSFHRGRDVVVSTHNIYTPYIISYITPYIMPYIISYITSYITSYIRSYHMSESCDICPLYPHAYDCPLPYDCGMPRQPSIITCSLSHCIQYGSVPAFPYPCLIACCSLCDSSSSSFIFHSLSLLSHFAKM